jgi:pimeloyl-ACP methyl ester carboxylesterase
LRSKVRDEVFVMRVSFVAVILGFVHGVNAPAFADSKALEGHWLGTMTREGAELAVSFDFKKSSKGFEGYYNCASQRALGIPLDRVELAGPGVRFVLDGGIAFEGKLSGDRLDGGFKEGDAKGTFSLTRGAAEPPPYKSEEVEIRSGKVVLSGTLFLPAAGGRHPAVVFNHGSGPEGRFASRFYADHLARRGIAALIYDKRGGGASTGDWRRSDFADLADDAIAAVHFLQGRPEVAADRVGIYGHSQGGTISPLIASRSKDVAFVIAAAAVGGPVYEQDQYRVRNNLLGEGFSEKETAEALAFYGSWLTAARTGEGLDRVPAAAAKARGAKWFDYVEPPPPDHWVWDWYRKAGNYDSIPYWEKIQVPVLLVYGERDQNTPVAPSVRGIEKALRKADNKDYTVLILPRAAHNLTVRPDPGQPFEWWRIAPGYPDLLAGWIALRNVTRERP